MNGHLSVVKTLLAGGTNIFGTNMLDVDTNLPNGDGLSPLWIAIEKGDEAAEMVEALIDIETDNNDDTVSGNAVFEFGKHRGKTFAAVADEEKDKP